MLKLRPTWMLVSRAGTTLRALKRQQIEKPFAFGGELPATVAPADQFLTGKVAGDVGIDVQQLELCFAGGFVGGARDHPKGNAHEIVVDFIGDDFGGGRVLAGLDRGRITIRP